MNFRIADTFTDSLAKLTGDEQKAVKTTAFDLQLNPANPGHQFHKLDRAKDKNFWSVRVSRDIRIIAHKTQASLLLCYVDHHDPAYKWAEKRKLQAHPKTGAAQIVEIRETVQEITIPKYVEQQRPAPPKQLLFEKLDDDELLSYGVPEEWLADVKQADEDSILALADHLPNEAAEALLELATGGRPEKPVEATPETDPFEHPDAQRRFRVMQNIEELERALEFPWEKWTVFLHPAQREVAEKDYSGPVRISGSAGTGKTIVALHRAAHLARKHPESRVLLTTFSEALAKSLHTKLRRLIHKEPNIGERLEVHSMDTIAGRLYERNFQRPEIASKKEISDLLERSMSSTEDCKFSLHFIFSEWDQVVDAWQLDSWEAYRDVSRLGRKTRLPEARRKVLWSIFERVRAELKAQNLLTHAEVYSRLAEKLEAAKHPAFDFAVIDEAQDVSVAQLRFLAALAGKRPNGLFFSGDLGQRIFQQPFSWKKLGVDIQGRSRTLKINYRTSHQIRSQADRLLGMEIADVDGNAESRTGTVSVFNGPLPVVHVFDSVDQETKAVGNWITECTKAGILSHEIGVFVRSDDELGRAEAAIKTAGQDATILSANLEHSGGRITASPMHLAKGLEFRAVAVMACDDEVIPQQKRLEEVGDDADLKEVYDTERHLLYVACTRARERLHISGVDPASEFLDDFNQSM